MKPLPEKLYVQYVPGEGAAQLLLQMQTQLKGRVGEGRPVPAVQLHVTVLHIGFVSEVYRQLLQVRPALDREEFDDTLRGFIDVLGTGLPLQCELSISGLDYFGPRGNVLVLLLQESEALRQAYEASKKALGEALLRIGIAVPAAIPYRPRALQVPESLNPHLTLFKGAAFHAEAKAVIAPYLGETLRLRLDKLG